MGGGENTKPKYYPFIENLQNKDFLKAEIYKIKGS